jgi:hypothetical protein
MLRSLFCLSTLILLLCSTTQAQEFNLDVQITFPALKTADESTLKTLETAIREFYNNTVWTDQEYLQEERIEGNIQINIKNDPAANLFVADLFVNTGRPVYQSNYSSPILNHVEKDMSFAYEALTPIINNNTNFTDNLSSILTFYAYVILGYDYDTFSPLGGDPYFNIAQNIINSVPANVSSGDRKWLPQGGDRNRYWIIENVFNARVQKMRRALYDYHRNGLDKMHNDVSVSKAVMLSSLKSIGQVSDAYRNAMIVQMFSNAKRQEILEVFKNSVKSEQRQVYQVMSSIDPSQIDLLRALR